MKRKRFTEEQIAFALTQADSGTSVEEVIRRMGVSEQACRTSASTQTGSCRWPMLGARSRHGGGRTMRAAPYSPGVAHTSGVCPRGGPKGCRMKPKGSPSGRTKIQEVVNLLPDLRWREWMGRVEAAIFASPTPVPCGTLLST